MPFRVAFDLDGTIADMRSVLVREAEQLFGTLHAPAVAPAETADVNAPESTRAIAEMPLSDQQRTELWAHVRRIENFWVGLPEIEPGIVQRIQDVVTARRWEVVFLTTRPRVDGETVQIQSQRWLEAHGFRLPSVFVVRRSRGAIAAALDLHAVVDDRPQNCLDVALDSAAQAILIWPDTSREPPPGVVSAGVRLAATISNALALLVAADEASGGGSVGRSLKRFFRKETAV